jgi:hypothetical protein
MPSRSRYPALPDKYWPFIEQCWSIKPRDRPSTEDVDKTIRNEFHSLSRAPQNPRLAVLCNLTGYITKDEEFPSGGGGFGEIWKCTYKKDVISIKVSMQCFLSILSNVENWAGCSEIVEGVCCR